MPTNQGVQRKCIRNLALI